jgi:hypothetical protein
MKEKKAERTNDFSEIESLKEPILETRMPSLAY